MKVQVANPRDEPLDFVATTYFSDEPTLQFGRSLWVPPRSRIQTWHPVLIPQTIPATGRRANFRTLVRAASPGREVLIRSDSGQLQFDGTLRVASETPVTGVIDILRGALNEDESASVELLIAAQAGEVRSRQNTNLVDRIFAPGEESLAVLDQLLVADGRVAEDPAGLEAIRRWLFGGGHLWVMLDRVSPRVLESILGDGFDCEIVDRVGLTTVRIEPADAADTARRSIRDYDRPVDFLRVAISGVEVAYLVDGWPAAFWMSYGQGRLLVTTLGARGWMRPRTAADNVPALQAPVPPAALTGPPEATREGPPASTNPETQAEFVPLNSTKGLAAAFFAARPAPLLPEETLEPHVRELVGYSIPARGLIVGLLAGYALLVTISGIVLWRRGRLEWLGAVAPGSAITVSLILVATGWQQRHAIPPTAAAIQIVEPLPGTDDVRVTGAAGMFSPEGGAAIITGCRGGWLLPEMSGLEGTIRRLVWKDLDEWEWENLPETAGLRSASFAASLAASERIEARATFGPDGVVGRLQVDPMHRPADVVLAARDGRIGVGLQSDGTFAAGTADVFAPDQFLAAALLTDEQDQRRQILEHLLTEASRPDYPADPQLMFWTDPWDLGFRFDADRHSAGRTLVVIPLHWERPAIGTRVTVPAPLLPFRETAGPDGLQPAALWDYRKRRWQEKPWPSTTWLRFQVPRVLLPAAAEQARLTLHVSGPVGRLEIAASRQNEVVPLKTWIDPVGTLSLEITQADLLSVAADGGLLLRVSGGDPERPELTQPDPEHGGKTSYWRIESLVLDLQLETLAAPPKKVPES